MAATRRLLLWLGVFTLALAAMLSQPLASRSPVAATQGSTSFAGELLYLNRGDIWRLDLATNRTSLLVHPPSGIITRLAHSPDSREIAYSIVYLDQMYRIMGGDIVVSGADGRNPQTIVREEEPGFSVGWPSWTADPNRIVYQKENVARGVWRVEEVDRRTGERTLVVEGGSSPAASPTEPVLVYETPEGTRHNVWRMDRATGTVTNVVRAEWFDDADNPTFAPDGQSFAFIVVGDGPPPESMLPSLLTGLLGGLAPRTASAHDMPGALFDLWLAPNGGRIRRVAQLFEMQPEISWSPDGRHIAVMGALQLQIVEVSTGARTSLSRPNGSGQLSWGRAGSGS